MALQAGIRGEKKFVVSADQLASRVGSGLVNVFATPAMIAGIENTALRSEVTFPGIEGTTQRQFSGGGHRPGTQDPIRQEVVR